MHNLHIGVCKRILSYVLKSSKPKEDPKIIFLENKIKSMLFPFNYHRKLNGFRGLKAMDYLLIFGFCDQIFAWDPKFGAGISLLGKIVRIVYKSCISEKDLIDLQKLVDDFLVFWDSTFPGGADTTHNFHLLSHLPNDIIFFGPSWTHSLFPFEGFNHNLNQEIHSTNNYQKRMMKTYNFKHRVFQVVEEKCQTNYLFNLIVQKIKNLKGVKNHGFSVNGVVLGYNPNKFSSQVLLNNGEIGTVTLKNGEIMFESDKGKLKFIQIHEIEKVLIKCMIVRKRRGLFTTGHCYEETLSINDLF